MMDNTKKLRMTGIFFIVATICYTIYGYFGRYWIFSTIGAVFLSLYCFALHKSKASKIIYFVGLGVYALLHALNVIDYFTEGLYGLLYFLSDALLLAVTVLIIIAKIKMNKNIALAGTVVLYGYAIMQAVGMLSDIVSGYSIDISWLLLQLFIVIEFLAFRSLWKVECGNIFEKKVTEIKTPLEDNLLSLKQLYDNNIITEEEYNQKKAEILNKL